MTSAQLAQWLHAPWLAAKVKRIEVEPGQPRSHVWLMEQPLFDARRHVCTVLATELPYEEPSEARPGGSVADPLIQPTALPFKIGYRLAASGTDCNPPTPFSQWIESRSEASVATALQAMKEAQASISADGSTRLPIACEDRITKGIGSAACERPGLILKQLSPVSARAVQPIFWQEPNGSNARRADGRNDVLDPANGAWQILYVDPAAPTNGRRFLVTLAGVFHPKAARLVLCRRDDSNMMAC